MKKRSSKRVRKSFCQESARYSTARVAGEFIGLLSRLSRSFLFNIFAFAAGFGCCFMVIEVNWEKQRSKTDTQIVAEVEKKLTEMQVIDSEMSHKREEVKEALENLKDSMTGNTLTNSMRL